jgi:ABC-type sulfate/molybdate transport systems ATPase subunit
MLRASLVKRYGAFALDVTLDVAAGDTLVLVGESGAGKTTVLRLLAGLARPDGGRIELDGACYFTDAGTMVPPWERDIGWVPQDSALFPHLTARENIAFGLHASGVPRAEGKIRGRRPHEMSGGQQQRVALARALVLEPKLLLLDEPLSALDTASRDALREELGGVLADRAGVAVFVTHNPEEAELLGDQVISLSV